MIMKTTNKNYFGHLWELFFYLALCFFIPIYFDSKYEKGTAEILLIISTVWFFLLCFPAIVLFFRYVIVNKNVKIKYQKNSINILVSNESRVVALDEVDSVEIKLTLPVFYNGIRFLATDSFLCAVVYLKTGENFTITTLIDNELIETKNYFKNKVKVERKLRFICWPSKLKLAMN